MNVLSLSIWRTKASLHSSPTGGGEARPTSFSTKVGVGERGMEGVKGEVIKYKTNRRMETEREKV